MKNKWIDYAYKAIVVAFIGFVVWNWKASDINLVAIKEEIKNVNKAIEKHGQEVDGLRKSMESIKKKLSFFGN